MKNLLLTCFIISFFAEINFAQSVTFQKSFAGGAYTIGRCVRQTNDGGYIFTGYAEVLGAGVNDVYLVKTDAGGDTLWTKTFGGSQYDDGFCVEQTEDGGYIVVGYTSSFGAGGEDVYLIKTNATGDTLWTRTYGGTDNDRGASVVQTADGGYIITGETYSYGAGYNDLYAIKTNNIGDSEWTKTLGTTLYNYGTDIIQTFDGNFMVSGGHWGGGAYLVKLNTEGDSLWTKAFIGEGPMHLNVAYAIKELADSSLVFAGISQGASGVQSYLQKTDSTGTAQWAKTYSGDSHVYTSDIDLTTDGGYILSGWSQAFPVGVYKALLIRTGAEGDTLWTKKFIGGGSYSSVQQTADGGFVLLSADNFHIYLTKTDANGNAGCNDANAWPVVTDVTPAVSVPAATESFGGTAAGANTIVEAGGTIVSLCFQCNLDVTFNLLPDTLCIEGGLYDLQGIPAGGIFEGTGVSGTEFNPEIAGLGTHQLTYTYSLSANCFQSDTIYAYVDLCFECNPDVSLNALPDTVCVDGVSWPLVGNPSDGIFSGPGVDGFNFYPAEAGVGLHEIVYTYSYTEDCIDSDTISVFVDECVSVNELFSYSFFTIYPNPVDEFLELNFHTLTHLNVGVKIFNLLGEEVYSVSFLNAMHILETADWPNGVYFCQVNKGENVVTKKFVVEH